MKRNLLAVLSVLALASLLLAACSPGGAFPLSKPGDYDFGSRQSIQLVDTSRADRQVSFNVYYPADLPPDVPPSEYNFNAEPDRSGAPYPLILAAAKSASIFGPHLASHGFTVVSIGGLDSSDHWGAWQITNPQDILFGLQAAEQDLFQGLEGMFDTQRTGVLGYSFDGYNALALSGARIDPQYYRSICSAPPPPTDLTQDWWLDYVCNMDVSWEEFSALAGEGITTSSDGLWQPMTDARIRAAMPMGPEGAWLFGEAGLQAVKIPVLIVAGEIDDINPYDQEAVFTYEHLGSTEKGLVTFLGEDHMMIFAEEPVMKMKHLAVAFFGYHLQGQEKYARYFSEDYINSREGLAWGVVGGE